MNKFLKYIFIAYLVANYKQIPGAYFVRFYWTCLRSFGFQRFRKTYPLANSRGVGSHKLDLFRPSIFKTMCSVWEIDMYLHKGNSTYFTELDMARTQLLGQQLQVFMNKCEINHSGEFKTKSMKNWPWFPVAAVECVFKNEIKAFQKYEIQSRIFAWDKKWFFILSKFVSYKKDKEGKQTEVLHTVCITRYVMKNGRKTIRPQEAFEASGLWNEEVERLNREVYLPLVEHRIDTDALFNMDMTLPQ
ncbi:hypothetical protein BABINDRAFT_162463 [Babjeviella inositovora NRRL Y-12698]|uniref:Thioesterase domain-containing protein n=1 Tax=Babjeviella inositovora NRRL Y-12698 TaxID=984486 RepID=A0A1E3QMA3_9ASCO|nr:uncharacterized protein BABINDRAFT_162463 [Babjeviella inositovora NRRL Y-12698]ODQ78780.1 hypothetical protein BABINDRAFT_162463 [Babjeviella inositovora NRRL Y-12698]